MTAIKNAAPEESGADVAAKQPLPIVRGVGAEQKGLGVTELHQELAAALAELTPAERKAVALLEVNGRSPESISAEAREIENERVIAAKEELRAKARPLELDFSSEPEPPDYIVDGMFERETVNLVSGDTGTAKSIFFQDLTIAAAQGRAWLGRQVHAERILYIDEENPRNTVLRRLRALGATNADRERFRYINRQGVEIGRDEWNAWLRAEIEAFAPDLVVIDTAMSSTAAEVNENDSVVSLYKVLRPLVAELGTTAVILHHNRKDGVGGRTGDRSQAAMGARQWVGQADQQYTLRTDGHLEISEQANGDKHLRREIILEGGKDREGQDSRPELVAVTSVKSPAGALVTMQVSSEGHVSRGAGSRKDQLVAEIVAFVRDEDRTVGTGEIAEAVDVDPDDGTFKAALRAASTGKRARLEKVTRGHYALTGASSGGLEV